MSVPLDAVPDPSLRYEVREDGPVVTHTNRAFDATFGQPQAGTPLRECLNEEPVGLDADVASGICSALAETGTVDVTSQSSAEGALRLRAVDSADSNDDEGLLTLAAVESDAENSIGVENIATVVSHDLRNPLDVAKAHLRAARERGDAEHFDRVDEAHDRMERIIEDVLTLARGDGTITPSEPVALDDVARDAWSTVDTNDASLGVSSDLPTVEADQSRLQRLFENLFRNAMEHGSTGPRATESNEESPAGSSLAVRVGTTADGGFFVADDGVGIPEGDRHRVFEPGYSSSDRGAGLGLTIVERIAEAHGWAVSIPAASDGGARFEFHTNSTE
ncbi:His Kinase A (phospho-acceptor) domain-containing protein [Haloarchaeobius iranensis]|uniref:histidine kinase n=1 Tax=Haloarchaeobius iranensis TaxID=996166 RepID=A0A1H0A199_9EURY|nr:His Kinase A (phospho-acceptor) domain-containing protein [Haloarchaeobius iranensis]